MNNLAIFSALFLFFCKTFCCEKQFILQPPIQQVMGVTQYPIPQYYVPKGTLPVIKKTVYHRMDKAIIDLHENGFEPSPEALEKTAATITHQTTCERKIGVCSLMFGLGTTIVTTPSPFLQSHPEITLGGVMLAICGTALLCDSMIDCCCWKKKMAYTKELIRLNHEKVN